MSQLREKLIPGNYRNMEMGGWEVVLGAKVGPPWWFEPVVIKLKIRRDRRVTRGGERERERKGLLFEIYEDDDEIFGRKREDFVARDGIRRESQKKIREMAICGTK